MIFFWHRSVGRFRIALVWINAVWIKRCRNGPCRHQQICQNVFIFLGANNFRQVVLTKAFCCNKEEADRKKKFICDVHIQNLVLGGSSYCCVISYRRQIDLVTFFAILLAAQFIAQFFKQLPAFINVSLYFVGFESLFVIKHLHMAVKIADQLFHLAVGR